MNQSKFENIMAHAQRLMLDENFNRQVESKANAYAGRNNDVVVNDFSAFESEAFGGVEKPIQMLEPKETTLTNDSRFKNLPEAIRESFEKTPPLTGNDMTQLGQATKKLSLKERMEPAHKVTQISNTGGIDYSLIKTIIDESVRRNLEELQKTQLNEATIKGLKISKGNKIQFLDSAGNLYEGVLTLKKRAKS